MGCIKFHLGEVEGEVQDVLHQVPAEGDGQLLGGNNFDKTKNEKKDIKKRTHEVGIWKSGMARL